MLSVTDDFHQKFQSFPGAVNIVSLVPSLTELLFDLGLENNIKGVTRFCIHPEDKTSLLPKVGGTKNIKFNVIDEIDPDIIIANKEENVKGQIEKLKKNYSVYITDIRKIEDLKRTVRNFGILFHCEEKAEEICKKIQRGKENLQTQLNVKEHIQVLYLIWRNPYMTIGKDTFINHMLSLGGFYSVMEKTRYPQITIEEIEKLKPPVIFLSSEPYPFQEKHKQELLDLLRYKPLICIVDGEMFSWYGSRVLRSFSYMKSLNDEIQKEINKR
jgi:ABC-type Fe3+-hydroxamate transport system substrate-binding protein